MNTIEDTFLATKEIFERQATKALQDALDIIYTEYLPHVATDTSSNQRTQICGWLHRFFADELREDDIQIDLSSYNAKEARQKIYEDNKDEIIKAIGADLQDEVEILKEQLNYYRRY